MNGNSHVMRVHHLLINAVCALMLTGCVGTQAMQPMDVSGTYYHIFPESQGVWETTGSDRTNDNPCTWTRTSEVPSTIASTIAMGRIARNQTVRVRLRSGEYFVSYGCKPWHMVS